MLNAKQPLVSFQDVRLRFPNGCELFKGINLNIAENAFYFLTGPSGAGKSTLLKMLYLDQLPTSGALHVFGKDVTRVNANQAALLRRKIGVVFQDFRLIPHLTALENVSLPLKIKGMHDRKREREAVELLAWVGLKDHLHITPPMMSGGQQQRVGVARALAAQPDVILMDEPFGALDPVTRTELQEEFKRIQARLNLTVIMVTHDMTEALLMADRIAVMKAGEVLQIGTPYELLNEPAHDYVREMIEMPRQRADRLEKLLRQSAS